LCLVGGGEEAEVVAEAEIPFEVVPGVTAAVAVPAYAGIPVTHRTLASTVAFVTGHEDPEKPSSALEWPRLASSEGTLVFVMGTKNLPKIVERLLQEGKPPTTPVAIIRWGTYARQRTVVGILADIVEKASKAEMSPPTVIVVGEVVSGPTGEAESLGHSLAEELLDRGAQPILEEIYGTV